MRCLSCDYDLRGLFERRCPECARPFDPDDEQTYAPTGLRPPRRRYILLIYLAAGLACVLFWATADSSRWAGYGAGMSLQNRLILAACQLSGPNAVWLWNQAAPRWWIPLIVTTAIWTVWLTIATLSPARRLPLTTHGVMAGLWCFAGCFPTGLLIT